MTYRVTLPFGTVGSFKDRGSAVRFARTLLDKHPTAVVEGLINGVVVTVSHM